MISEAGNLPAAFTTFVGRRRDIVEIRRLLGPARLLTLTGLGGVGKTRLALAVAATCGKAFPDGCWLVDLAPVREPSAVAGAAATALGVPDLGARPVLDDLARHLAGRRALIVLDNCEYLVDACAELADRLLSASAELRILATSRKTLGITGEHVVTVSPLSVPDEAVELLRDRATAVRPDFRITEANWAGVRRLCADLEGLPLAIELAASKLRTLTVDQAVDRLEDDRFKLLTGGSQAARPQQRTLRALIDWSYDLCRPAERLLWNRLSVFTSGFGLDAAEGVCSGAGIARDEVLDVLDRLVAQSVVLATEHEGLPRYRLLETIRQYGRQRLAASGEEQRLLLRHREFFRALAERIADGWYGPGQEAALARLRAEHGNMRAALDCGGDPQATLALAAALRFHWCADAFLGEGRRRLDRALAAAPEPTPTRAKALWVAAWVALLQGDHPAAERWLDEAEELGERSNDLVVGANVLAYRGTLALFKGQRKEAESLFEEALATRTTLGEGPESAFLLFQLAAAQTHPKDQRAAETGRRAIAISQAHGERWARAHALWALSLDAWLHDDLEAARALVRDALEIERGFGDYVGTALMIDLLAWITASQGDHERAARLLGAVRPLWRDTGTTILAFGPLLGVLHSGCEEAIVRALGPAAYEQALTESGHRHDNLDRAVAYALGGEHGEHGDHSDHREHGAGGEHGGTGEGGAATATPAGATPLTRREREVAALVAQGMNNRVIAAMLVLSPRTVEGHVENIRAKLGFGGRAQIAAWWAANQTSTP
ncbi:LuxR C-terminal-related transcriptional regulator [Streptomyces fuscichromogenes]|uniref:LuxR C-terminal-related transcriptional regulator n=1 Tax=Streptomyces fuscichromogenes TaxID=1324013 RepID=UPI003804341E